MTEIICLPLVWVKLTGNNGPEDNEECLWCTVPIVEPPYLGCYCSEDWPGEELFTHYCKLENGHFPPDREESQPVKKIDNGIADYSWL